MSNKLNMSIQTGHTSSAAPQSREYQENEGFSSAVSDKLNTQHFNSHFPGARPDVSRQTALRMNKQRKVHYLIRVDWSFWEATVNCELFSRGWRCMGLLYWCWNDPPFTPLSQTTNVMLNSITRLSRLDSLPLQVAKGIGHLIKLLHYRTARTHLAERLRGKRHTFYHNIKLFVWGWKVE